MPPRRLRVPPARSVAAADPSHDQDAPPGASGSPQEGDRAAGGVASSPATPAAPAPPTAFPDPLGALIPFGSICTLSGASGVGKTAFLASMIRALQGGSGPTLFGQPLHPPTAIGVLACDRPWRDHNAWFQKAGCGDLPHVSLRDIANYQWDVLRRPAEIPKIFGKLIDAIGLPAGGFLIVDPLPLFIPGRLIDYKDMAIGFGLLDQQIQARQLTMLGVFHVAKQKANKNDRYQRPQDRILGSSALIGYSETAFYLLSPDEADRKTYEFGGIPHQMAPLMLEYTRGEDGLFVPAHELDHVDADETALACFPPVDQTMAATIAIMQIRKALNCGERTAYTYVRTLLREGRIQKVGKGLYQRARPS
jgi:hypothetical protein